MAEEAKNIEGGRRCFVGDRTNSSKCSGDYTIFSDLNDKAKELVDFVKKANEQVPQDALLCLYHKSLPTRLALGRSCVDPLKRHSKKSVKKTVHLNFEQAKKLRHHNGKGFPGVSVCKKCCSAINKLPAPPQDSAVSSPKRRKVEENQSTSQDKIVSDEGDAASNAEDKGAPGVSIPKTPDTTSFQMPSTSAAYQSPDMFAESPSSTSGPAVCFFGYQLNQRCSDDVERVTAAEKHVLYRSFAQNVPDNAVLCSDHRKKYMPSSYRSKRLCCNPFKDHGERKSETFASLAQVQMMQMAGRTTLAVQDGLCKHCSARISTLESSAQVPSSPGSQLTSQEPGGKSDSGSGTPLSGMTKREKASIDLTNILKAAGVKELELTGWHDKERLIAGCKKYDEIKTKVKHLISASLEIDECDVSDTEQKSGDVDNLVDSLKLKISSTDSYEEKVKFLTLAPVSWSHERVAEEFGVTVYMARKAKLLKSEKGILPIVEPRQGRSLPSETLEILADFFADDEFSRECPGSKQQVRIGKGQFKAKRLLLGNLSELYKAFKDRNPEVKVGRSIFCASRPKWCVFPSSGGMHSVCVCVYHENFKLLLSALNVDPKVYKDLICMVVCSTERRSCMLRMCRECPKYSDVIGMMRKFVAENTQNTEMESLIDPEGGDLQLEEPSPFEEMEECEPTIKYRQWLSTDRPNLETVESTLTDFSEILSKQLLQLIPHSYATREQSTYLKNAKEALGEENILVLMDFSENWTYVVQDEIQSHHFQKGSCTLHPVVIYYREEGKLCSKSFCYVSDDLKHDVAFVDQVQEKLMSWVKSNLPKVTSVEYFTDGCAAQYKNCKQFFNLCSHLERFELKARWSFFATAHGKTVTDGVGGGIKLGLSHESLRRVNINRSPINNVTEVLKYLEKKQEDGGSVEPVLITKDDLVASRERIAAVTAITVQGTRSFHRIEPLSSSGRIRCKRLSSDEDSLGVVFDLLSPVMRTSWEENSFVACAVEGTARWRIALIQVVEENENEANVLLLAPEKRGSLFLNYVSDAVQTITTSSILCEVQTEIVNDKLRLQTAKKDINKLYREWKKKQSG